MKYKVIITKKAEKELKNIPGPYQKRIRSIIDGLAENPFIGKKMRGKQQGFYSFKAWPYRIIYIINKNQLLVVVVRVGHRQWVYSMN